MAESTSGWIGVPLPRLEDPRLLSGQGRFLDDIHLPGALHVALVRSSHAHARILGIDTAAARAMPGVVAVCTAADGVPGPLPVLMLPQPPLRQPATAHPLARDTVRYVGEPVAVVVAADRYLAEDAAEAVLVTYDPLPVVADLDSAAAPDAPRVHPHLADNVAGYERQSVGDMAAALAGAAVVLHGRFCLERGSHQPLETRRVAARWDPELGQLTAWIASQTPHRHQRHLCRLLGLAPHQVRVLIPDIGGAFGQKGNIYPEDILIPWLARRLGRPVRWSEDRLENMRAATQDRVQEHEVTLAADTDGRLLAFRDHFRHDLGAYCPYGVLVPAITAAALVGPYQIANLDIAYTGLYTNRTPTGVFRGPGRVQAATVMERMLDRLARHLGLDPAVVRRRNLVPAAALPHRTGLGLFGQEDVYDTGDFPACLEAALAAADYTGLRQQQAAWQATGRLVGVGLGLCVEGTGSGPHEGCTVRVAADGKVYVYTSAAPHGQGQATTLAQVVAGELGVEPARVQVIAGDTAHLPYGTGTFGSRSMVVAGGAAVLAAQAVRERALAMAARQFEVTTADLEVAGGRVQVRGLPSRGSALVELAGRAATAMPPSGAADGATPGLEATRYFYPREKTYAMGVHVVAVEVDAEDATLRILRYVVLDDSGTVVNPRIVAGQVCGGVAQGLGAALLEQLVYDHEGQLLTGTYADYLLPTAVEIPDLELHHRPYPTPRNPLGVKGAGEAGVVPVVAAISGAIEDALGGPNVEATPVTRQRLWQLLRSRDGR